MQDGTHYKSLSMKSIRAAIGRFLCSPPHNKQTDKKKKKEKKNSEIENLLKQLFHSPLLDTRLVTANEPRRAYR